MCPRKSWQCNLVYQLNTIVLLRKAVSQAYNSVEDSQQYIECTSMIDDLEEQIVSKLSTQIEKSEFIYQSM